MRQKRGGERSLSFWKGRRGCGTSTLRTLLPGSEDLWTWWTEWARRTDIARDAR